MPSANDKSEQPKISTTAAAPPSARDTFDPLEPATQRDPHAAHRELRRSCPIAHSERWNGFWVLSRFDDIVAVTKQHETFINSVQNVVPAVTTTGRRPPLHLDPPEHTLWRKAMSGPFKQQALAELESEVRRLTIQEMVPLLERGSFDLVAELAATLPVLSLCAFLHAPEHVTAAQIKSMSDDFLRAFQARDNTALEAASRRLYALAEAILETRRREPLDPESDVASALLAMRIDGEPASETLLQGAVRQLLIAGHVAVTMMMGSSTRHLALDHELQHRLRSNPILIPAALEELLRLYTPNQGFCRTAAHDVKLHGQTIQPREPIVLLYPSANRDETKFETPDEFHWGRTQKHVAFGNGVHKCPGELLARLELRVFLEELLARTAHFDLAGVVEWARWPEYGPRVLPLRVVHKP
jgi:cytochrome P450